MACGIVFYLNCLFELSIGLLTMVLFSVVVYWIINNGVVFHWIINNGEIQLWIIKKSVAF
jgi:hypothetical protein